MPHPFRGIVIPPPKPAPYLSGVPSLPATLASALQRRPSPQQLREARRVVTRLRALIRVAREQYEQKHQVRIAPELPLID